MVTFDPDQYRHIVDLRENCQVLKDITSAGLPENGMVIALTCSDGDRFQDYFEHHQKTQQCKIHPLSLNGGAMLLSEACPENNIFAWHRGLTGMILKSCSIKQTNIVALSSHWPCAVASEHNLSVDDVILLTIHGRLILKQLNSRIKVYCCFHVAHLDGRHRTYTIDHQHKYFQRQALLNS